MDRVRLVQGPFHGLVIELTDGVAGNFLVFNKSLYVRDEKNRVDNDGNYGFAYRGDKK